MQKEAKLKDLNNMLKALLKGERNWHANLANTAALIFNELEDLNWAGFYLLEGDELVLGPFQGLPACVRIGYGKGVCGSAIKDRKTYLVEDVHKFPGHIACDATSRSEIVIPLILNNRILGVLDIDSPVKARFDEIDQKYLEETVDILLELTDFNTSEAM